MSLHEQLMQRITELEDNSHIFGYKCEESKCGAEGIATVPIGTLINYCPVCGK